MIKQACVIIGCSIKGLLLLAQHNAYINADVHLGTGKRIYPAVLITQQDKIESVQSQQGFKINPTGFDSIIDLQGQQVYPALINPNSILGLHDAEAVRASRDFEDVGVYNPHLRAQRVFNTDNPILPTVRRNGILITQVTPRGGRISGQSSIMSLFGWNWEDATLLKDDGLHLNFPEFPRTTGEAFEKQKRVYNQSLDALTQIWQQAQSYCNAAAALTDIRLSSMCSCIRGTQRLYIHVHRERDILQALEWLKKMNVKYPVLVEAEDSWKVSKILARNGIPVLISRVFSLPDASSDPIEEPFTLAAKLYNDSVCFAFQCSGDMEAMQARNLSFMAGQSVSYGLPEEAAIRAMTGHAALILGINEQWGTLEPGKKACFIVSQGSILDVMTHRLTRIIWNGRSMPMDSHQEIRAAQYRKKYNLK